MMVMEFGLLGPLTVRCGPHAVPVRPGHQRSLLAALLLDANQVVASGELAGVLWGAGPPPSARVTIRNYVKRLRQALGDGGRDRLSTEPRGYLIRVEADELDVSRFEGLVRSAQAAMRGHSWDRAAAQAGAALALWRGEPLADIDSEALIVQEAARRLGELRLQALETRIEAELHLGGHAEVIAELQHLAGAFPLREHLHALRLLALYRSGRRGEALAAYREARNVLVEELGTEPAAELQRLHRQILAGDPALAGNPALAHAEPSSPPSSPRSRADLAAVAPPVVAEPPPDTAVVVPRQLPGTAHLTGRAADLARLSQILSQVTGPAPGTMVTAISGTAGVGKTALAVHWAHQVAGQFPGGQLYVNLGGFGPAGLPVTPAEAIRGFLDALEVPAGRLPASPAGQAGLYRSLLASRPMLILLDNALDEQQVRPLLPGSPGSLVLVTSRHQLVGLVAIEGATLISLDVLPRAEASQMIRTRLGRARAAAGPAEITEITELCARLPLALAVAGARAAAHPQLPLPALAAELRDSRRRLDALDTGDQATSVRAALSWSHQSLAPAAARMFRLLSLHPGPAVTPLAAASLAAVPPAQASQALDQLARVHLVTEYSPDRYGFHDLLRAYATEQAQLAEDEPSRQAAVGRVIDHYLHTARRAALLLDPRRDVICLGAALAGTVTQPLNSASDALAWLDAEHRVLLALVGLAAGAGLDGRAWQLARVMRDHQDRTERWLDLAAAQPAVQSAAQPAALTAG
jgi:DNA-binding SARP family transcriptional activator